MQIADPRSTPWEVKGQRPKPSPCQGQDGVLSLWPWEGPAYTHVRAGRGLRSLLVRTLLLQGTLRPRQARVRDRCTGFATSAPSPRNSTGLTTCSPAHECRPVLRPPPRPSASPVSPSSGASPLGLPPRVQGGGPNRQERKSEPGLLTSISQHPRASPLSVWAGWKAAAGPEAATRWQALRALL